MTRAFLLVQTAIGKSKEVRKQLREVPGVRTADVVTGEWDVIGQMEADSLEDLNGAVLEQVHAIPDITRTMTCVSVPRLS